MKSCVRLQLPSVSGPFWPNPSNLGSSQDDNLDEEVVIVLPLFATRLQIASDHEIA